MTALIALLRKAIVRLSFCGLSRFGMLGLDVLVNDLACSIECRIIATLHKWPDDLVSAVVTAYVLPPHRIGLLAGNAFVFGHQRLLSERPLDLISSTVQERTST